jgi:hypothetical protein
MPALPASCRTTGAPRPNTTFFCDISSTSCWIVVDANVTLQQARSGCALHSGDVGAYADADKQLMVEVGALPQLCACSCCSCAQAASWRCTG